MCNFNQILSRCFSVLFIASAITNLVFIYTRAYELSGVRIFGGIFTIIQIGYFVYNLIMVERLVIKMTAEVDRLGIINVDLNSNIGLLEGANEELQNNTESLKQVNSDLQNSTDALKRANIQLLEIQKQSQALLSALMQNGDKFTDFGHILEETTNRNLSLAEKLQMLVNKISIDEFAKIDTNHDGFISIDELKEYNK